MIISRKLLVIWIVSVLLVVGFGQVAYSEPLCKVISPKRFAKLHSFPVNTVVEFSEGARPHTFKASLNNKDITGRFQETARGMQGLIGPKDGLRINIKAGGRASLGPRTVSGLI
jgi:hypothetical protein